MFEISGTFISAVGQLPEQDRDAVEEIKKTKDIDNELHELFAQQHSNIFTQEWFRNARESIGLTVDIVIQAYALARTPDDVSRLSTLGVHMGRAHPRTKFVVTSELESRLRELILAVHEKFGEIGKAGDKALERRKVRAICAKLEEVMNRPG